jgi:hypothetical protein
MSERVPRTFAYAAYPHAVSPPGDLFYRNVTEHYLWYAPSMMLVEGFLSPADSFPRELMCSRTAWLKEAFNPCDFIAVFTVINFHNVRSTPRLVFGTSPTRSSNRRDIDPPSPQVGPCTSPQQVPKRTNPMT